MKKSFRGVDISIPKAFKPEVEECIEKFIDYLEEITPASAGAPGEKGDENQSLSASNIGTQNTTAISGDGSDANETMEVFNKWEDKPRPVLFVECPEKERQSALLCAAVGWARQHHLGTSENINRIVFMSRDTDTLMKVKRDVEGTDFVNLLQIQAELPHTAFTFEETNRSEPDVILTKQYAFYEALLAASSKYQLKGDVKELDKHSLKSTLVIVEDAHMLDQVVRDAASGSLSLCVIENFIKKFEKDAPTDHVIMKAIELSNTVKKLFFRGIIPHKGGEQDPSFSLEELDRILHSTNIMGFNFQSIGEEKLKIPEVLQIFKFVLLLINVMSDKEAAKTKDSIYRLYASDAEEQGHHELCPNDSCRSIKFVCLDGAYVVQKLMKMQPYSVILSSSSLQPFIYLKTELGIKEAQEFVGKSSIEDHQIFARILTCGAGGYFLNSSYNRRFDNDYLNSLGKTIVELAKVTPSGEGIVIYLSSYEFRDACLSNWKIVIPNKKCIWDAIGEYKDIFALQSKSLTRLEASRRGKGSCVLAVLRSEASEYTFLPIECRRVAVIVGVPFVPTNNPQIQLKIQYNRCKPSNSGGINMQFSSDFRRRESYKPIRQVIDNQISSLSDYSVILLLDTRYDAKSLSPWLSEKIIKEKRFVELLEELTDFFHLVKNRIQWIQEKKENPTQASTQFGSVPKWEMEKLCLEYKKLKKTNDSQERLRDSLQKQLSDANRLQSGLETKLKDFVSPRKRSFPV